MIGGGKDSPTISQWSQCVQQHKELIAQDLFYPASSIPLALTTSNVSGGHGGYCESNLVFIHTIQDSIEVTHFEPGKLTGLEATIMFLLCKGLFPAVTNLLGVLRAKHKIELTRISFREKLNPTCKFSSCVIILFVPS